MPTRCGPTTRCATAHWCSTTASYAVAISCGVRRFTWQLTAAISSRSRLLQLVNELRVRRNQAARRAERRARGTAAAGEELGLSRAIYLEPPPREWEESWRVTDALIGRFAEVTERDGADFFVLGVSNGIQVHRDPAVRRAYADRLGVTDLDYPERRLEAILARRGIPHALSTALLREQAQQSGSCVHGFENAEPCGGHWNQAGHRGAGELLAHSLCRLLSARGAERSIVARRLAA